MTLETPIGWTAAGEVRLLDQTRLPAEEVWRVCGTVDAMAAAIEELAVRGAPLIGVAGAMGLALALGPEPAGDRDTVLGRLRQAGARLRATRPTAVNLAWAIDRVLRTVEQRDGGGADVARAVRTAADEILAEEQANCRAIGAAGVGLVPDGGVMMTICNAGALATGGIGTATAPFYLAHEAGRRFEVLVPETRPLLQGARLTAWELTRAGIACTLLPDGAIAARLARGDVAFAISGADRIAANGDVANKIGTLGLALAAQHAGIPFYVAAPQSTFDRACPTGREIPIESRAPDEVRCVRGVPTAPPEVAVWNPAFDVTPARLVHGYLTEDGFSREVPRPRRPRP